MAHTYYYTTSLYEEPYLTVKFHLSRQALRDAERDLIQHGAHPSDYNLRRRALENFAKDHYAGDIIDTDADIFAHTITVYSIV